MPLRLQTHGLLTPYQTIAAHGSGLEDAVTDLVYLLVGVGVFALFAGYAVLLRRA
jgi:hypothetical protein